MEQFREADIVFEDDDWDSGPQKLPHSNVKIHDNGCVSADVVDDETDEELTAYYSPDKVHAVFPE